MLNDSRRSQTLPRPVQQKWSSKKSEAIDVRKFPLTRMKKVNPFFAFFFELRRMACALCFWLVYSKPYEKHTNPMCKNYGHVVAGNRWLGRGNPRCDDCGELILDPDQLRKSSSLHVHKFNKVD